MFAPGGHPGDSMNQADGNVIALSAFVDLYLSIYPAVVLWKLNMSVKKRLALMCALGLGSM